jgi:hypothetical protein
MPLEVGTWRMPIKQISASILSRISEHEPRLEDLAGRHLARLTPDRWTIEWHLPLWLGRRFELDSRFAEALVASNVLGLLSIRLQDDLEDGEVPPGDIAGTRALAPLAYELALAEYRVRFDETSPIWAFIERTMADWRAGAAGMELATRGAPLKIAGYACCLRAGRLDLWPTLERCLGGAVTALVRYDQFCDWEADLDAGRWNAFVASVVDGEQDPARRDRNRAAVLTTMLTRDVVREQFDAAVAEATDAATLARDIGATELADFLTGWATRTSEQGAKVVDHYRTAAEKATRLLFGTRVGGALG